MAKINKKVVFFGKDRPGSKEAILYLRRHFLHVDIFIGKTNDGFPKKAYAGKYDICISYISPWLIPKKILANIKEFALNFHPGTPNYRGIGCTNFALYNGEKRYGVTAHLMATQVDAGKIIAVRKFAVSSTDSVYSVTLKCYKNIIAQFYNILNYYLAFGRLPRSKERWGKKLYTRKELDDLCRLDVGMLPEEIRRRVRATFFPNMPGPYLDISGLRFEYVKKHR